MNRRNIKTKKVKWWMLQLELVILIQRLWNLNSIPQNLHYRIKVDTSLITGNDLYVAPTGGSWWKWSIQFTLSVDTSVDKILNLSRLFWEFQFINPTLVGPMDKAVDVSFVNISVIVGYSQLNYFTMIKMLLINQPKAMHINPSSKIVCLTITTKRTQIFRKVLGKWWR